MDHTLSYALTELGREVLEINEANGWNVTTADTWNEPNKYRIPAILALIHSEVSEALEAYRKGDKENFIEELADTLIRLVDLTAGLEVDLAAAVKAKLAVNRTRGYRHGGKAV